MKIGKFLAMMIATVLLIITPTVALAGSRLQVVPIYQVNSTGTGSKIGIIRLKPTRYGVWIKANLRGLTPGKHGFHLHQNSSCAAKNGVPGGAAGGHYDPKNTGKHAGPGGEGHLGDLLPLHANARWRVKTRFLASRLKMNDFKGRAFVIHAGGDNFSDTPKPLGGGGARVGCGVIN
ncbi:MAG: superoxide dismutase family protein [Nostocaceae cyanobacterium]|nr:superoxide dismutase family protein [Nostocaceae cyanobacterium]